MTRMHQLGNRTLKRDTLNSRRTEYTYDTDFDPNDPNSFPDPNYVTRNNRLLYYKEYDTSNGTQLVRTVSYQYLGKRKVRLKTGTGTAPESESRVARIGSARSQSPFSTDEYPGSGDPNEYTKYYALRLTGCYSFIPPRAARVRTYARNASSGGIGCGLSSVPGSGG